MDRFDEMAVALVNKWLLGNEPAKIADIAAALRAAATVPKDHVRTGTTDHKLEEPRAWMVWCPPQDECDYRVYFTRVDAEVACEHFNELYEEDDPHHKVIPLYEMPTREAADAAKEARDE